MTRPSSVRAADILGYSRLAIDATAGMAHVVEAMHQTIAPSWTPGSGAAGVTYGAVRAIAKLVGCGMHAILTPLIEMDGETHPVPEREAMLAAVNGIVGDHLAATANPLAISMCFRRSGRSLRLKRQDLAATITCASSKVLVLVHGLCMNDLQWTRGGHNHGEALAAKLGWTLVHLHYNSGLHISTNGRAFAALMENLVQQWPARVREVAIIGHSSGGLLSRSAYHYGLAAGQGWPRRLRQLVFLGTPHHGSALERAGNLVNVGLGLSPYSAPLSRIAGIRSPGITDLRYGNLLDEDWNGIDRFRQSRDLRRPVPLPKRVRCYAIAASIGCNHEIGDGLVSVDSAMGRHPDPRLTLEFAKGNQWVGHGLDHWDLLGHPAVYQRIRKWLVS